MTDNLELWEKYFKPHKDATKKAPKGLTAIDPMWNIRCATEQWGPMGDRWGFKVLEEKVIESRRNPDAVHQVLIEMWYPSITEESGVATIQSFGGTPLEGEYSTGSFFDDDAAKKSVTDALSKALSWLGFGAAVHMGMFDSNKYCDIRPPKNKKKQEDAPVQEEQQEQEPTDDIKEEIKKNINNLVTTMGEDDYRIWHSRVLKNYFKSETIKELTRDQLIDFARMQTEHPEMKGK